VEGRRKNHPERSVDDHQPSSEGAIHIQRKKRKKEEISSTVRKNLFEYKEKVVAYERTVLIPLTKKMELITRAV